MECDCGFKFSGAGEFRNHDMFLTKDGLNKWVIICPKCKAQYSEWFKRLNKMKCNHMDKDFNFKDYKYYKFCPLCGESLWTGR